MKNILILFILLSATGYAQNGINYKALIKDASGNVIANTTVQVQFTIVQDVTNVYTETHSPTTDNNGIIIVNIGEGTATSGNFNTINWAVRNHSLNVQIDTGSGFVDLGTTQFMSVPYAKHAEIATNAVNVNGLEAIDEGNGIGWRLVDRNAAFYGDIGQNAVDLSYSNSGLILKGALGLNSFATGFFTTASGDYATSMGFNTEASGDYSTSLGFNTESLGNYAIASGRNSSATGEYATALGYFTTASGDRSTAMGSSTTASEDHSTAMGRSTTASGFNSTAMGFFTEASGNNSTAMGGQTTASGFASTAMGNNTTASSFISTAMGRFNIGGGNPTSWSDSDPLFEIGNGTSNSNRSNALTVYKNGSHVINSNNDGISISADDGIVILAEDDGIIISAGDQGAIISGSNVGVYASGGQTQIDVPDIILGSSNNSLFSDDGIISTNPLRAGSDMFLRSYDAVVLQLDYDNNEAGNFRIRNGNQDVVFDVNESGNLSFDGRLEIGTGVVESPSPDITINTIDDVLIILDNDNNETGFFGIYNGNTSDVVFQVQDSGNAFLAGSLSQNSDRRLKTNIQDLKYGLNEILKLKPKQYHWKNKEQTKKSLGLIAQEVQPIIKEVITTQDNVQKTLGVSYTELIPVLIKAIQEQQKIIDNEKSVNTKQYLQLEALLSRIEILETNNSN